MATESTLRSELLLPDLARHGERIAVVEPGRGKVTYARLDSLVSSMAGWLRQKAVRPGDRIGLCLARSTDALAIMLGSLRASAAYVPVDATAPIPRNAGIFADCAPRVVLADERYAEKLRSELAGLGKQIPVVSLTDVGLGNGLERFLSAAVDTDLAPAGSDEGIPGDLAYVLYTSGSTGKPKGVMITRENAVVFVDWCVRVLRPSADDRFANHAQFHFDISVLDIYTSLSAGAAVVLVPDDVGRHAGNAAQLVLEEGITVWYSAPSILASMGESDAAGTLAASKLRIIAFAGEVFPITKLKELVRRVPRPKYLNLYGPTETNVCTYFELPANIDGYERPVPIGRQCEHYEARVVDAEGNPVSKGSEGELVCRGPGVMFGYWGAPHLTREKLFPARDGGRDWYRTGDLVIELDDHVFDYRGRVDRMVKVRGYRVELGEVEARLYEHADVAEAAVIAISGPDGARLHAHVAPRGSATLSALKLKLFCSERLPTYMVPARFHFRQTLPRTTTNKVDYQSLAASSE